MSNSINTELLERAGELLEEITKHPSGYDRNLMQAIEDNDLFQVKYWVNFLEGELSKEHFFNRDIV